MIEAQRPKVGPAEKAAKPLPGAKGAAAEGGILQAPPGQPENIRLTVAFAERYGLIAKLSRSRRRRECRGVSDCRQLRRAGCLFFFGRSLKEIPPVETAEKPTTYR